MKRPSGRDTRFFWSGPFSIPTTRQDVKAAHALQDAITVKQADKGKFEDPGWKKEEVEAMREKINVVAVALPDSTKCFGRKEDLDPIYWLLGAAYGWGGLPVQDSAYTGGVTEKNDGKTPYILTVKDVPVDAFWSVTVYDDKGMFIVNEHDAYSYNTSPRRRMRTEVSPSTSGATPGRTTSSPSCPAGTTSSACTSREKRSSRAHGNSQYR